MSTANEISNEARHIATSPSVAPGSEPKSLELAELVRNLASLVSDLAARVEEIEAGRS